MTIFGLSFSEAAILFGALATLVKMFASVNKLNEDFKSSVEEQKQANKTLRDDIKEDQREMKESLSSQIDELKEGQKQHEKELKEFKQDFVRLETSFNLQSLNLRKDKGGLR